MNEHSSCNQMLLIFLRAKQTENELEYVK